MKINWKRKKEKKRILKFLCLYAPQCISLSLSTSASSHTSPSSLCSFVSHPNRSISMETFINSIGVLMKFTALSYYCCCFFIIACFSRIVTLCLIYCVQFDIKFFESSIDHMKVKKSTIPKLQEQKQELEHDRNSPMLLYYYNAKWINIYEKKIRIEFPTKLWHAEIKSNEWERRENKLLFSIHLLYEYIRTTIKHTHKTLTFLCLTTTNTHTHTRIQTFSGHTKKKKHFETKSHRS